MVAEGVWRGDATCPGGRSTCGRGGRGFATTTGVSNWDEHIGPLAEVVERNVLRHEEVDGGEGCHKEFLGVVAIAERPAGRGNYGNVEGNNLR